ncbi:MAG: glycosyltransferase family 4 protein [Patescibacteria group bacterium]
MKRVAIFSITYDPFIGGAEVAIKEVAKRLPDFFWDLFTARLDKKLPAKEKIGNINVYRVGTGHKLFDKWFYAWRAAKLAVKLHQKNPYDIIHAVLETYAGLAALLFKKRFQRVPYVLTLQSGDPDTWLWWRTWFWYPFYRQIYTRASKVTAISQWLASRARRYGYRGEIAIIPNGVDVEHFSQPMTVADRKFVRSTWGVAENAFVIVTASRLVHKNGVDILIESLLDLPDDVVLVVVGSGQDEGALKEKVKSEKEKIGNRVVFLGHIGHDFLPRVLKACDVFARPSRSEGLGNAFLEAMAANLPVVATPVGGIVDFIKDGATGLLVAPENAVELSAAIKKLYEDKNLRQTLAINGESLVKSKYDWSAIAADYNIIYGSL